MTRFSCGIVAPPAHPESPSLHDAAALCAAWLSGRAKVDGQEAACAAYCAELETKYGFDSLSENERARTPGVERLYDLEDQLADLNDAQEALLDRLPGAHCATLAAAASKVRIASILIGARLDPRLAPLLLSVATHLEHCAGAAHPSG